MYPLKATESHRQIIRGSITLKGRLNRGLTVLYKEQGYIHGMICRRAEPLAEFHLNRQKPFNDFDANDFKALKQSSVAAFLPDRRGFSTPLTDVWCLEMVMGVNPADENNDLITFGLVLKQSPEPGTFRRVRLFRAESKDWLKDFEPGIVRII
jgi:hypothetical protein